MDPISPTEWRVRHDAFGAAARQLRRLGLEGPSPRFTQQLDALAAALEVHMAYEEDQLLPRYAPEAPAEGPGSVEAVRRDHRLIREHVDAMRLHPTSAAEALFVAERAAKLEALLEHHDLREARFVLPVLDGLGVVVELEEPALPTVPLGTVGPARWPSDADGLQGAAEALAQGRPPTLPPAPSGGRQERHAAKAARALRAAAEATEPRVRRDRLLEAFDAVARWRWMTAGQRRVSSGGRAEGR